MKIRHALALVSMTAMLTACDLAPKFHLPLVTHANAYKEQPVDAASLPEGRKITLGSIKYKNPKDWVIWLNNSSVTPKSLPEEVADIKVERAKVYLKWKTADGVAFLIMEPGKTYDLMTLNAVPAVLADINDPGTWKVAEPSAGLPRGEWWQVFKDDTLDGLEEEALKGNQNVKAIAARAKEAREEAKISKSYIFPTIDNTTSFTRRQPNAVGRGLAAGTSLAIENDINTSMGLSYEVDLFGHVRGGWLAATFDARSAAENLQSVRLALQADVAEMYFAIRAYDRDIDILNQGVKLRQDNVEILKKKVSAGDITDLDLSSSVVDLETTRSQLQGVQQQRAVTEHALAVALGKAPAEFSLEKAPFTAKIPVIPAGLPSALLERRPDVTAAQYDLQAANERIGLAKAAFFPELLLTGSGGFESDLLGSLFKWSSRSWSVGPLMTLPIFGGGRAVANLHESKDKYEESVATYREKVLESFRDVEDSLTALKTLSKQSVAQGIAESASRRAAKIATSRYDEGDLGYLETISARRDALEAERAGVEIHRARLSATITLIRAIGGGWDAPPEKAVKGTPEKPAAPAAVQKHG